MSCNNCFNGCSEIISDRCVRYTGVDIPILEINTGDSYSDVIDSLTVFLMSAMNGTGIHPDIDPDTICDLVKQYLPCCNPLSIVDFINALIKASCSLQEQVNINTQSIAIINADYDIDCLTEVTSSSDTHIILQAVITKLCLVDSTLTALQLILSTDYSSNGDELDLYIANYLSTHSGGSALISNKMIPFVAYPYFGSTSNFNSNGEGTGDWLKVYLCNGYLGKTPDMRGRVIVAATACPGPAIVDPKVLPGISNPNYIVGGAVYGDNTITLDATTVPNHSHTATATATQASHSHYMFNINTSGTSEVNSTNYSQVGLDAGVTYNYTIQGSSIVPSLGKTETVTPLITVNSIIIAPTVNGGGAHSNIQPGIAAYYIMYVP